MEVTYGTAMHEARVSRSRTREMSRFLHHYRRWNAHIESAALERNMRDTVCERLAPVVKAAAKFTETLHGEFNFGERGLSFVHAAFTELLECRSALQHSYAFSYIRFKIKTASRDKLPSALRSEKHAVERCQAELERMTEQLSDVVARSHLRATQTQILFLTAATAEKRKEFSNLMVTILAKEKKRMEKEGAYSGTFLASGKKKNRDRKITLPLENLDGPILSDDDGTELPGSTSNNSDNAIDDENSKEEIEAAIRASLARFMANTGELDVLNVESDNGESDAEHTQGDWSCSACTYVNSQGTRCAMCGTGRQ